MLSQTMSCMMFVCTPTLLLPMVPNPDTFLCRRLRRWSAQSAQAGLICLPVLSCCKRCVNTHLPSHTLVQMQEVERFLLPQQLFCTPWWDVWWAENIWTPRLCLLEYDKYCKILISICVGRRELGYSTRRKQKRSYPQPNRLFCLDHSANYRNFTAC